MSISDSSIKGKFDELAGKAKQAFGETTGDESTADKGAAQQVKGQGEQAWGSVKETAHDATEDRTAGTTGTGHDLRDRITTGAENVKDRIEADVDHLRNKN